MFNERLKQLRSGLSMSQKELAGKLEVSQQTVAKWENGSTTPNPETLLRLAVLLESSTDYLLGLCDENLTVKQLSEKELKIALFGKDFAATDEMLYDVMRFAEFIRQRSEAEKAEKR